MSFAQTLFDMVGGDAKLDAFVDDFASRIKANPELGPLYPDDMTPIKSAYKAYAKEMLGGPKEFSKQQGNHNLSEAHRGIQITRTRADEMIKCAVETMDHFHLPKTVQGKARERLENQVYSMVNVH